MRKVPYICNSVKQKQKKKQKKQKKTKNKTVWQNRREERSRFTKLEEFETLGKALYTHLKDTNPWGNNLSLNVWLH